ncbi:MAG: hypothetical protein DHS20C13_08240 [Thermodesulfobacteriota bacterium]|nr:MAG: hypothetical protein DHS20C13_08240 [Thermodesulfobacteriota bacterium]
MKTILTLSKAALFSTAIFALLLFLSTASFAAPEETVTNTNDSGPGSLRQAVLDVDPTGVVILDQQSLSGMSINLTSGPIIINKALAIRGFKRDEITIDGTGLPVGAIVLNVVSGGGLFRDFTIRAGTSGTGLNIESGATVNLNDARVFDGVVNVEVAAGGELTSRRTIYESTNSGSILVNGGTSGTDEGGSVELEDCIVRDSVNGITLLGGFADNAEGGKAMIIGTVFSGNNLAGVFVGGGQSDMAEGGDATVINSLITDNTAGIFVGSGENIDPTFGGILELINSTVAANTGTGVLVEGGNNSNEMGGIANISFSTIINNGPGLAITPAVNGTSGMVDVKNTLVVNNITADCSSDPGDMVATGTNFDTDGTCNALDPDFTMTTSMALNMGMLGTFGGSTDTVPPVAPSVAIDAVTDCTDVNGMPVNQDGRTFTRPFGPNCDVGAVEVQPIGSLTINKTSIPPGLIEFLFGGTGFPDGCIFDFSFVMDDGDSFSCVIPTGQYFVEEFFLAPGGVNITCDETPVNQTFESVTLDIAEGDDVTCTFANNTLPLLLNPIFPGIKNNVNSMTALDATPGGQVAFVWGFQPGSFTVGGSICNGIELGIFPLQLLGFVNADGSGVANFPFFVPSLGNVAQVYTQAVDIPTCRTSDVVENILGNN